ncbi:MAG: DNA repair protein RadC [Rikenellaceae bacterium]
MYSTTDKLLTHGVESLSNGELLIALLDDMANSEEVTSRLLERFEPLSMLTSIEFSRLRMIEGIGAKRAKRILCAIELGRRCYSADIAPIESITSSEDVVSLFKPHLSKLLYEECWVLYLNTANRVVEQQRISQGGVNSTIIDTRLVVKRALELLATQIVLVHNHPSGDATPSSEDIDMTQRIKAATALFDITLLDHIIISPNDEYSMLSGGDLE